MKKNIVITIARQYGSGGHDIGMLVAKELGIPCLDKELITAAVSESGMHPDLLRNNDEKMGNPLGLAFAAGGAQSYFFNEPTISEKVYVAESDVILDVATKSSCVIIGRCASYVLRDKVEHLSVFVNADLDFRMARAIEVYGEPERKIRENLHKRDKQRAHYHQYYTGERWMDLEHYDITVSSSALGIEHAANLILQAAQFRCLHD